MEDYIFLIIFGSFILIIIIVTYFNRLAKKKKFESFLEIIPGETKTNMMFGTITLTGYWNGKKVNLELIPGSKHSPEKFHIYFYREISCNIVIYPETTLQKIAKKINWLKEIETGISSFDQKYIIQSDDENKAKQFLNIRRCDIIESFFEKRFVKLALVCAQPELLRGLSADDQAGQNAGYGLFEQSGGASKINMLIDSIPNFTSGSFKLWKEAGSFVFLEKNYYIPTKEELADVLIKIENLVK